MEQHHKFSNGGHVVHRQKMPGSKCKFSVWYDSVGFVLDISRIDALNRELNATPKQWDYFCAHKPCCIFRCDKTKDMFAE